jgi:hypothetical protein
VTLFKVTPRRLVISDTAETVIGAWADKLLTGELSLADLPPALLQLWEYGYQCAWETQQREIDRLNYTADRTYAEMCRRTPPPLRVRRLDGFRRNLVRAPGDLGDAGREAECSGVPLQHLAPSTCSSGQFMPASARQQLLRCAPSGAHGALHVPAHPLVRTDQPEGRFVRAVQCTDCSEIARSPRGDVPLGARIGEPVAQEHRLYVGRLRAISGGENDPDRCLRARFRSPAAGDTRPR